MVGTLIKPNLHAALIHIPVALVTLGVVLEVLSVLFWRKSAIRAAARWMIVLGILAAVPTLTTGLYALRQTASPGAPSGELWESIVSTSTWSDAQWATLREHVTYAAGGALLLLMGIVIWIGGTDNARRHMYLLGLVVLIVGGWMMAAGAHEGGELVYKYATAVQMPDAAESVGSTSQQLMVPSLTAAMPDINAPFSPLELHLLFAGCAIAIIAAAVGLSVRLSNVAWENRFAEEKAVAAGYRPAGKLGQGGSNLLSIPVIYPGAFWIAAILLLVATGITGLWVFGFRSIGDVISLIRSKQANDEWRPVLHIWYAASILALAIVLGLVMKIWPRRRLIMGMLCTLLVLAVAGQAWTGILMLYDGNSGSVLRFNRLPANRPIGIMPIKPLVPATKPVENGVTVPATTHTLQTPAPTKMPTTLPD